MDDSDPCRILPSVSQQNSWNTFYPKPSLVSSQLWTVSGAKNEYLIYDCISSVDPSPLGRHRNFSDFAAYVNSSALTQRNF